MKRTKNLVIQTGTSEAKLNNRKQDTDPNHLQFQFESLNSYTFA